MSSPGMKEVQPVWYHYNQVADVTIADVAMKYSFSHWVDEQAATDNFRQARDLCMEPAQVDALVRARNWPAIKTALLKIDALLRGAYMSLNTNPWVDPAFVMTWRRLISGGDADSLIRGQTTPNTLHWNTNDDLDDRTDSISNGSLGRGDTWKEGETDDGFGDGRSVRVRPYGQKWLAGIRRGTWAARMRDLYRQFAVDDPDRANRKTSMFAPNPWFWFLDGYGMGQEVGNPWSQYGLPGTYQPRATNVISATTNLSVWRQNVQTDTYDEEDFYTNWSYHHRFDLIKGIDRIVAVTPPGFWMFEFYRMMLDEVLRDKTLAHINRIRKYVTDRNAATIASMHSSEGDVRTKMVAKFTNSASNQHQSDPNVQAAASMTQAAGPILASVATAIGLATAATGPGAIIGASIAGVLAITGMIIGMVDKDSLKDDFDPTDKVDEMGRVKPIILPAMIWFKSTLDVTAHPPIVEYPQVQPATPVTGWVRPNEYTKIQALPNNGGDINFNMLPVPDSFTRVINTTRESVTIDDGRTIQYSTKATSMAGALDLVWSDQFKERMGFLKSLLGGQEGVNKRIFDQAVHTVNTSASHIAVPATGSAPPATPATDSAPPQSPTQGTEQHNLVALCDTDIPDSFALASMRDSFIAAHPDCREAAMLKPVQIPMWWYAAGAAGALVLVGTGVVIVKKVKSNKKKAKAKKAAKMLASSTPVTPEAAAAEYEDDDDYEDEYEYEYEY